MADCVFIYITCRDEAEAQKIAEELLRRRLIACANIFPIRSLFWWQNEIQRESEHALICKTKFEKFEEVERAVRELHSYEVPCICCFRVEAGFEGFLRWISDTVK